MHTDGRCQSLHMGLTASVRHASAWQVGIGLSVVALVKRCHDLGITSRPGIQNLAAGDTTRKTPYAEEIPGQTGYVG